jgi:hypothetical protein
MNTTQEKIIYLTVNKLKTNALSVSVEDFKYICEINPEINDYLLEKYWEMPVYLEGKKEVLHIPAINVLFMMAKDPRFETYLWDKFKDKLEPFKEIYINSNLVHGLDLISITKKKIDTFQMSHSLNIKNTNQLFSFINKNYAEKIDFDVPEWKYEKHFCFDINYKSLFAKNWDNAPIIKQELKFNAIYNQNLFLDNKLDIEVKNLNQATDYQMGKFFEVVKYKLKNNQKSFAWDEDKISTLISSNIFKSASQFRPQSRNEMVGILTNILQEGASFTPSMMSLLYIKDNEVHDQLKEIMKNIEFVPSIQTIEPILPKKPQLNILESYVEKYRFTDSKVIQLCEKILKEAEFLSSEKSLEYFAQDIEQKYNFDKLLGDLMPRLLGSYFAAPESVRSNPERVFLPLTLEQLGKVYSELENMEYSVLENEMKKIKVIGKVLDSKFTDKYTI